MLIVFISQSTLSYLEQQTQVTAFFKDDFSEESILALKGTLEQDDRIAEWNTSQRSFNALKIL